MVEASKKYEVVIGTGGARAAPDQEQDVLLLSLGLHPVCPQHRGLPSVPGDARYAPGHQQQSRRVRHYDGACPELRNFREHPVPSQELPLPGPDEGLSDFPVRRAYRQWRMAQHRGGRCAEAGADNEGFTWRRTWRSCNITSRPTARTTALSTLTAPGSPLMETVSEPDHALCGGGPAVPAEP